MLFSSDSYAMKHYKVYIYFILFCILLQNSYMLMVFAGDFFETNDSISILLKKSENCKSEEDSEESEEESKEENEPKEKEKEFNQNTTSSVMPNMALKTLSILKYTTDSEIFTQYFETETPPPKSII